MYNIQYIIYHTHSQLNLSDLIIVLGDTNRNPHRLRHSDLEDSSQEQFHSCECSIVDCPMNTRSVLDNRPYWAFLLKNVRGCGGIVSISLKWHQFIQFECLSTTYLASLSAEPFCTTAIWWFTGWLFICSMSTAYIQVGTLWNWVWNRLLNAL